MERIIPELFRPDAGENDVKDEIGSKEGEDRSFFTNVAERKFAKRNNIANRKGLWGGGTPIKANSGSLLEKTAP